MGFCRFSEIVRDCAALIELCGPAPAHPLRRPVLSKVTVWSTSYSDWVVYTKTIMHLSVDESGGYLPRCFAAW